MPINPKFQVDALWVQFNQPYTIDELAKKIVTEKEAYVKTLLDYEILVLRHHAMPNSNFIDEAIAELEKIKNSLPCQ